MQNWTAASLVFAQATPATPFGAWVVGVLGTLSSVIVLISGLLIFGRACYLVATRRRPAALAAYLVLLPLPMLIAVFDEMRGMVIALTVIASSPGMSLPTEHFAANTAASLVMVLFAMLVSAPTYFALAFGLLASTLRSPSDDVAPTAIRSKLREPLLSSRGIGPGDDLGVASK